MLKISKMLVYKSQKYFYILSLLLLVPWLVFFFFFSEMFFVLWRLFQIIVFGWQVIGQRSTGHISRFTGSQIFGQILDSATSGSGNVLSRLIELIFFSESFYLGRLMAEYWRRTCLQAEKKQRQHNPRRRYRQWNPEWKVPVKTTDMTKATRMA